MIDEKLLTVSDNGLQVVGRIVGNENAERVIIFSHGFGVKSDSRQMFTKVGESLKENFLLVRFHYVSVDDFANTTYAHEYSKQVEKLKTVIDRVIAKYPNKKVTIIAHSQGCYIPPLLLKKYNYEIEKLILLAPPPTQNIVDKFKAKFTNRPGSVLNMEGNSELLRSDESKTIIPSQFWTEAALLDPISLYKDVIEKVETHFVIAKNDTVLIYKDYKNFEPLHLKNIYYLENDHNFEEDGMKGVIQLISTIL
jgi:pimeloyl-ACP methyl ester carboxylesterase